MKKVIAIAIAAVIFSFTALCVSAASGSFVASPSGQRAPELISGEHTDSDCPANVIVTSYADRALLGTEGKAKMEAAYSSIASTSDLGDLSSAIDELAKDLGTESDVFMVSELFDVSYKDCDSHEPHEGKFKISLKPAVTENFAALIHYNGSKWEIVEGAEIKDGRLYFESETLSPFAIIVHDGNVKDNSNLPWIILLDVLIACAAVAVGVQTYKLIKKAKSNGAQNADGQNEQ